MEDSILPKEEDERETSAEEALSGELLAGLRREARSEQEAFASLQQELRRIAQAKMRFERGDHTLQPTALVNEAFLKFFRSRAPADFAADPGRAIGLIARMMEQILNDYADYHGAAKRGGPHQTRLTIAEDRERGLAENEILPRIENGLFTDPAQSEEIIGVRGALKLLRETSPRQARVVQLQFYGGLTQEEIAGALNLTVKTVKLDWRKAKAFLKAHLASGAQS